MYYAGRVSTLACDPGKEPTHLDFGACRSILGIRVNETIRRFRDCLRRKEFDRLVDCWLELLASTADVEQMLELADLTGRHGPGGLAGEFLSLLAEALGDRGEFVDQLAVLRQLADSGSDFPGLAERLADCFRRLHPDLPELERLLLKSGLGYGHPLREALARMDCYLAFQPGLWVYDPKNGPGLVTRLDHLLDRVTVRWQTGSEETIELEAARARLHPTRRDGFFSRREQDRDGLAALASTQPGALVRLLLEDLDGPATADDINGYVGDLVVENQREAFWERARRALADDPHIIVTNRPVRSYTWSRAAVARPGRAVPPAPKRPREAPSEDELARLEPENAISAFRQLSGSPQRRRFLEELVTRCPQDWPGMMERLFYVDSDRRARSLIEQHLSARHPDAWRRVLETTLTDYRQQPGAFIWLAENAVRLGFGNLPGIISRLADLLESNSHRGHWPGLRAALTVHDLALLRAALEPIDEPGARRLLERLARTPGLKDFRKDEIRSAFAARYPALGQQVPADAILGTASSIRRAHDELARMVHRELPAVADEIARARAHGDLSENYEYKAAREKQARLMARINRLREDLARARPLVPGDIDTSRVSVGCRVRLRGEGGRRVEYTVLGPWDSDPDRGVISYFAPLGQQLLERRPGDGLEIDGHAFTIDRIEKAV